MERLIAAIHVAPDEDFEDWVVRDDRGLQLGHFPTRESAEAVAETLAQRVRGELIIHLPDGRTIRKSLG